MMEFALRKPAGVQQSDSERVALVLSAGGVFGAYQVGVWKALADSFKPDLVVGASIGSVNGWLIAAGCPPSDIERLWLDAADLFAIRPKMPRHWSHGVLSCSVMERHLAELCRVYRPSVEFAAVLTELPRMRPRCFTGPELDCRHLMASCAVPGAFDLQRIDGKAYADGGVTGALPCWAAVELGATRIVAVNVMPPTPLAIQGALSFCRWPRGRAVPSRAVEILTVQPVRPLGAYYELLRYRRERVLQWIQMGCDDGMRIKHSIAECFERK